MQKMEGQATDETPTLMERDEGKVPVDEKEGSAKPASDEQSTEKKARKRKKHLLNQITKQMEFYFSPANITKDRFMSDLLKFDSSIPIATFFRFNRIRSLTTDLNLLKIAISKSSTLQVSEDGTKVTTKEEIQPKADETECTIYVENIPSHADHEWVRQVFSQYGTIDYISLPRFGQSGRPKGFVFVEFGTPEMAKSALEAFGALDANLPTTLDPADLQSIKTFGVMEGENDPMMEGENEPMKTSEKEYEEENEVKVKKGLKEEGNGTEKESDRKRRLEDNDFHNINKQNREEIVSEKVKELQDDWINDVKKDKKRKLEENGKLMSDKKRKKKELKVEDKMNCVTNEKNKPVSSKNEIKSAIENDSSTMGKKKKKKRKRNKKEKEENVDTIYLQVMSKADWKKLRNKYLNAQRENMRALKKELQERHLSHPTRDFRITGNPHPPTATTADTTTLPKFAPGTIIKITFEEPPQDPKKLREAIRENGPGGGAGASAGVAYVDVSASEREVFVRFHTVQAANAYRKTGCWSRMEVLDGEEEKRYWEHINTCWSQRRTKRSSKGQARWGEDASDTMGEVKGREKLLDKAVREAHSTRSSSHIVFED